MKAMTEDQQAQHERAYGVVMAVTLLLDNLPEHITEDEDVRVARARLESWLDANLGRWVA